MPAQGQQTQAQQAAQLNTTARRAIQARGIRRNQVIYNSTVTPANSPTLTINPRNVGLILGFWVKVVATITNASGVQIDLADLGAANTIAGFQFNDLQNNTRIQSTGWHINRLNSWKTRREFASAMIGQNGGNTGLQTTGGSYQGMDSPLNDGSNWTTCSAPKTIAATTGTGTVTMWYYVPLAYNPDNPDKFDLRGAVYANVVNSTMQLFLTFCGAMAGTSVCVANGADSTQAMYYGNAAGSVSAVTMSSATVTVYQDYFDQLPTGQSGVLLPILDLATIYELKYTSLTAITTGADFGYQYGNFRDFLSTMVIYVNTASTGARGTGADILYWALQSANFTNIWKEEPSLVALRTRQHIGVDNVPGMYVFDSRIRPISTTQFGNMQLNLNAITAGTGAYMLVAVEDFALVQQLSMAGSLAAN